MAEIINLRRELKKKAQREKRQTAERNRVIHGRSKAERLQMQKLHEKSSAFLEGHRRDNAGDDSE